MKLNKLVSNKIVTASLVAALSLGIMSTSALAADDDTQVKSNDVTITIESGGLHLTEPGNVKFEDVTLKGKTEVYKAGFDKNLKVEDFRGTYDGWNLTAQASQFTADGGKVLPTGSLKINGATGIHNKNDNEGPVTAGTKSGNPEHVLTDSAVVDGGSAVSIVKASKDAGAGTYDVEFGDETLELTVDPTTAKKGTYTSTITWTLENTPDFD